VAGQGTAKRYFAGFRAPARRSVAWLIRRKASIEFLSLRISGIVCAANGAVRALSSAIFQAFSTFKPINAQRKLNRD